MSTLLRSQMQGVFAKARKIMDYPASGRAPFWCCDLVGQEELFELQNLVAELALEAALALGREDELVEKYPQLFQEGPDDE